MGTSSSWTPERRAKQAEAIRKWKPWEQSTGPKTEDGKLKASQNARRPAQSPELVALWGRLIAGRRLFKGLRTAKAWRGTRSKYK